MDSSSFDPETSLSSLTKKCLNLEEDAKKESLSNLTAKYNSSRKNMSVFGFTTSSRVPTHQDRLSSGNKTLDDGVGKATVEKPKLLSSSEDESDSGFPALSLVALAAKHKTPAVSISCSQNKSLEQDMAGSSSEDEYTNSVFMGSLVALAAKHKGIQNKGDITSCLTDVRKDKIEAPGIESTKVNLPATCKIPAGKSQTMTSLGEDLSRKISEGSGMSAEELNQRYITASFSDDSDSDDTFTLGGLALKHAATASKSDTKSADDKSQLTPKELQRVANFHRHYSKSESDQFAVTQMDTGNITNSEFRNESSTSLGSSKGNDYSKLDFKFSLGCDIPHSFKSKHMGLTSSLSSIQVSPKNLNSSFSDPDVSTKENRLDKSSFQDNLRNVSSVVSVSPRRGIGGMGGIDLACAIKSSSVTNVTQDDDTEGQAELMDEDIVTLLDNMIVDEDVDENKSCKNTSVLVNDKKEDCCLDARYVLKVKSKLRTVRCSSLGNVVCKQWRPLNLPYIKREEIKSRIVPFKFTSPSPDDVMAGFRSRRLQSSLQQQCDNDATENNNMC